MQPKTKHLPAMTIVGLEAVFGSVQAMDEKGMIVIPVLWQEFNRSQCEVKAQVEGKSYGVINSSGQDSGMTYLAGVEVTDASDLPKDMLSIAIPEGNYAVFTHRGPLSELKATMGEIYGKWFQQNMAKTRKAPHLEIYDERFDFNSPSSEFEICVPVQ